MANANGTTTTPPNGATKPLWRSGTAYIGTGTIALMAQMANELKALPQEMVWPHVAVILGIGAVGIGLIAQRAFADFGKYGPPRVIVAPQPPEVVAVAPVAPVVVEAAPAPAKR